MPTVSWVFEIKHSVGFQRGSPARPGLGDRRVTTPPPLSPVIDLLFIGVAHSPTISPIVFAISTQVGALLIRTPPFHSSTSPCFASRVVLSTRASFSRSLAVIKAFVVSRADRHRLPCRLKLELCSSELPHFTAHLVVLSTRASFSRSLALIKSIALCAVALHGPIDCRLPEPSSPDAPCARSTRVVSFDAGSPDARPRASPRALAEASRAARTRARLRGPGSGGPARPRGPALPPQRTAVFSNKNKKIYVWSS